ncbi:hypothetical protein [Saprospira grandis]|uniref:hypothetical protein n=1 Tax=Saprospira grandis TaxID=1008 RepID=UPI0022DD16DF|nr:hypothetical protein [Saprospira grandis]WBM75362.1 hypothetical protein OP864_03765 [Saprospira grandis]
MKKLLFLTLALLGLGLSSCQKEEFSTAPCTDCIEISSVQLLYYTHLAPYSYYGRRDYWDRYATNPKDRDPDIYVKIWEVVERGYDATTLCSSPPIRNCPSHPGLPMGLPKVYIDNDSEHEYAISVIDEDLSEGGDYDRNMARFYITATELKRTKPDSLILESPLYNNAALLLLLKYH